MKKHVIVPIGICLFLLLLSGFYLYRKYTMQVETQKKLMVMYVSEIKAKLNVVMASSKELPHIVKPIIGEINLQDVDISKKYAENISLLEHFYIENNYFIKGISVFNKNGDTFNLYRDKNGEFIRDVYKSRTISTLHSVIKIVVEDNSLFLALPVYYGDILTGNVLVNIDIVSLHQKIFKPYVEYNSLWPSTILCDESLTTLPVEDLCSLSHEEEIMRMSRERRSGFTQGKITSIISSARVITYFESFPVPEYYLGVAFSSNISPLVDSSVLIFGIVAIILSIITMIISLVLHQMMDQHRDEIFQKDKEINVLQMIYNSSPVAFIVKRNNRFFAGNNYFFEMFKDFASIDHVRNLKLPFNVQHQFDNWDLCTFERKNKEISLGRRQVSMELDEDKFTIDAYWDLTEMEYLQKEAIRSKILKTELFNRVSSDVRKTLNNVTNAVTLLIQQLPEQEHIVHINNLTTDLSGLVDVVQDYADIEAGRIMLDEIPFNLVDEIKKLTEKYYPEAQQKGVDLQAHIAASTIRNVVGDPHRFRQIIDELLSNAVKYTNKGTIRISLETVELRGRKISVKCSVEDTGQGISKERLKQLFFLDLRAKGEEDAIGLGVIITRKLISMMGGKLTATSPSPLPSDPSEPGVQFAFSIICYSDQPPEKNLDYSSIIFCRQINVLIVASDSQQVQYLTNFLNRKEINSDVFLYDRETADLLMNKLIIDKNRYQMVVIATDNSQTSFDIAEEIHQKDLTGNCIYVLVDTDSQRGNYLKAKSLDMNYYFLASNDLSVYNSILETHFPNLSYSDVPTTQLIRSDFRILIADHNVMGQIVAQVIFKKLGYEVDIAHNISSLEEQLKQKTYDIIFIDLYFPPNDGFETAKMLRKANYKMPIIAMTATQTMENLKRIAHNGMNGHLPKPLTPDNVKQILFKWIS